MFLDRRTPMRMTTFTVRLSSQPGDNDTAADNDDHRLGSATESDYASSAGVSADWNRPDGDGPGSDNLVMEISRTVIKDNGPRCTLPMWILRMSR